MIELGEDMQDVIISWFGLTPKQGQKDKWRLISISHIPVAAM